MILLLVNLFFLLVAIVGIIIVWVVWPPDSPWAPWWRTNSKKSIAAGKLANISSKDFVYELGSGDANFLVAVCKKYGARGFGVEIDPIRDLVAKINIAKNGLNKKVEVKRGNFYDFNYSKATVVFCYLVPRVLEKLKPKLKKELKKGTRLISYRYQFKPDKKIKLVRSDKNSEMNLYKIV